MRQWVVACVVLVAGCSYESSRRAHSHPLEARFNGRTHDFRSFTAGWSRRWNTFWFEGATIPTTCGKMLTLAERGTPERALAFAEFSVALPGKSFAPGRHALAPDPTRQAPLNAMIRVQTPQMQSAGGINGGAFFIDGEHDGAIDLAMDVDKDLVHLAGTFRATLCPPDSQ